MSSGVVPGQAGAAEHHLDVIARDIIGDAAEQEIDAAAPVRLGNARAPQLQDLARIVDDPADVELAG